MDTKQIINRFYVFQFLSGFHFFSAVLVPFFTVWGGTSLVVAQGLQSWFMLCVFLLEVPTGVVADMIGRRMSLVVGSLTIAVAALVYGSVPNIAVFVVGELLFATGIAFMSGADNALLYDSLAQAGKQKIAVQTFGRSKSYHLAGIAIAAIFGGIIAKLFGINAPMLATSVPALLAAAVAFTIPEPEDTGSIVEQRSFVKTLLDGLGPLKASSVVRRWAVNGAIVATSAYFVIWLYQPLLAKIGVPLEYYGFAHAALVVCEMTIAANFDFLVKVSGSLRNYLNATMYALGLSMLLAALAPNLLTFCLFLIFAGGFGLTRLELMNAEINKLLDSKTRATALSTMSMIQRLTNSAMNPVVGYLTDKSVVFSLFVVSMLPLLTMIVPLKEHDTD